MPLYTCLVLSNFFIVWNASYRDCFMSTSPLIHYFITSQWQIQQLCTWKNIRQVFSVFLTAFNASQQWDVRKRASIRRLGISLCTTNKCSMDLSLGATALCQLHADLIEACQQIIWRRAEVPFFRDQVSGSCCYFTPCPHTLKIYFIS